MIETRHGTYLTRLTEIESWRRTHPVLVEHDAAHPRSLVMRCARLVTDPVLVEVETVFGYIVVHRMAYLAC